jgi:uncharacterized protein involved in type VI secretion and phage assembly
MSILEAMGKSETNVRQINGVVPGIITNNQDPNNLGRVKIYFPWLSDDNETDWVRIAALMAGNERGSFFLPEVDDEVLVAFEQGDINYPYVIGFLWNAEAGPPESNENNQNNIRKITSRSGHEIIFNDNDTEGKEKVEIRTNSGHKIVLDDSTGAEKIEIVDKTGNNKMTIDSVKNEVNIESALALNIKATTLKIESSGTLNLESSGLLTIKGSMVKIN